MILDEIKNFTKNLLENIKDELIEYCSRPNGYLEREAMEEALKLLAD